MYEQLLVSMNVTQIRNMTKNLKAEQDDDFFYVPHLGKYGSRLTFKFTKKLMKRISTDGKYHSRIETIINPLWFSNDYQWIIDKIGFNFNGVTSCLFGKYIPGKNMFYIPHDPEEFTDIMIKVMWGGSSALQYRGVELPHEKSSNGILYNKRVHSNAGGCGVDYYVLPIGSIYGETTKKFVVDDIFAEGVKMTLKKRFDADVLDSVSIDNDLTDYETASAIQRYKVMNLINTYNEAVRHLLRIAQKKEIIISAPIYDICGEYRFSSSTEKIEYLYNTDYIAILDNNIKNLRNAISMGMAKELKDKYEEEK